VFCDRGVAIGESPHVELDVLHHVDGRKNLIEVVSHQFAVLAASGRLTRGRRGTELEDVLVELV